MTYDLFFASNAANGRLLSCELPAIRSSTKADIPVIGILAAMLQARHVRPSLARIGELNVSRRGILSCSLALALLACLPLDFIREGGMATFVLYSAAAFLAYTSATVVTGLTAAAASCCDSDEGGASDLQRGRAMGSFRSKVNPILR